jgi:hypothetical protein
MEYINELDQFLNDNKADMLTDLTDIVSELKRQIKDNPDWYIEHGTDAPSIDIRLCVDLADAQHGYGNDNVGFTWLFRTGLVDYDQRHSMFCAASCVTLDTDVTDLLNELINQIGE